MFFLPPHEDITTGQLCSRENVQPYTIEATLTIRTATATGQHLVMEETCLTCHFPQLPLAVRTCDRWKRLIHACSFTTSQLGLSASFTSSLAAATKWSVVYVDDCISEKNSGPG